MAPNVMPAYDRTARRQSIRRGAERGVWVFIPAEDLERADISADDPPPKYRVWPGEASVFVRLYRSRHARSDDS